MSLFLCLSGISLGRYCRKSLAKSRGFGKKYEKGGWSYRGVVYRREGLKPSAHFVSVATTEEPNPKLALSKGGCRGNIDS